MSIRFDMGFTHDLGDDCKKCEATEAACAHAAGCCGDCSHWSNFTAAGERLHGNAVA